MKHNTPAGENKFGDMSKQYRARFQPANQWEDEAVKRLVLKRWERDKGKPMNRDRMAETFLKRQANALETLAAMKRSREAEVGE